jgi:hypothetical protein
LQDELIAALVEEVKEKADANNRNGASALDSDVSAMTTSIAPVDFGLPRYFMDTSALPTPQAKPSARVKSRSPKKARRATISAVNSGRFPASSAAAVAKGTLRTLVRKNLEKRSAAKTSGKDNGASSVPNEDYSVFKPTCARAIAYDPSRKGGFSSISSDSVFDSTKSDRQESELA